ncbi:MAG: DUF2075 domain-containing protein [Leptospiraceae bacterium]|nr:DUF2075 domain-containing protein [Leptospiraceae bacterium]
MAPIYSQPDAPKIRDFIGSRIKYGDKGEVLDKLERSPIKPSKQLADSIGKLLKGNSEFVMIDEQKVIYEHALELIKNDSNRKKVFIIEGGPGTGKSVVAINLLVKSLGLEKNVQYVSKNAAPRNVYESKLTKQDSESFKKSQFSLLFSGSGQFISKEKNSFDALIIDEAHRLNEKSGLYQNLGENQIKEIINAAKTSIFFLDEDQRVTIKDIGSKEEIIKWAKHYKAEISTQALESQFRCNGSDGYLAWLDNILQIRSTANLDFSGFEYDFQVIDDPNNLFDLIVEKNKKTNKSRLVAGYCWKWKSKKDDSLYDIEIPEFNFYKQWNFSSYGNLWIISPKSVEQIGCIHTCQGLEMDYVGVIIGGDLRFENGNIVTDPYKRASSDKTVHGFKKAMKEDSENTINLTDRVIKNTYKTLMTRGMKGCYIYCVDESLSEYFKQSIPK